MYSVEPADRGQRIVEWQPLSFNVHFMVRENTAKDVRIAAQFLLADGPPSAEVSRAVSMQFKATEAQQLNYHGPDLGPGTGKYQTVSLSLTDRQVLAILAGRSTIYVVGTVHWVNPSGSDGHSDGCTYLQKPIEPYLNFSNSVWHECGI